YYFLAGGGAKEARRRAGAVTEECSEGSSVAGMGRGGGRRDETNAWGAESLECGEGSLLGAAQDQAGVRGEVRSPAGHPLPSRHHVSPLAIGQVSRGLPLRSAGGGEGLRAGEGVCDNLTPVPGPLAV